jgi:hypothetical protein
MSILAGRHVVGLDEVVVVGYGTRLQRRDLQDRFQRFHAEQLQISAALCQFNEPQVQGQVSGVTVTNG